MKTVAIVQARMGSTRFPGKVMEVICGQTLIEILLSRLSKSKKIDQIIVATPKNSNNYKLIKYLQEKDYFVYQGSEKNVLQRYYEAAQEVNADTIVRVTGDCPLTDAKLVDSCIEKYQSSNVDYVSNIEPASFPDGLDVEVLKFSALKKAWKNAKLKSEFEHVTPYIWDNPELFLIGNHTNDKDLSNLRLTVDVMDDFKKISEIFKSLYPKNKNFSLNDVLVFLKENPEIDLLNNKINRNEGYMNSKKED